jgi:hypothetical protein
MPSLATRTRYQGLKLDRADAALEEASETLEDLAAGTLDLDAITVGGQRYETSGGDLTPVP